MSVSKSDTDPAMLPGNLKAALIRSIGEVDPASWNGLTACRFPFLRYEFLSALETNGCLGEKTGWLSRHLIFSNDEGLVAAAPMYLKFNSFGEFVFDWSWADAYHRAGLPYYPKLVIASPFTPATGPRILMSEKYLSPALYQTVLETIIRNADESGVSSVHSLFNTEWEISHAPQLLTRSGCQFHWKNNNYQCFDEFLSDLTSQKRKQIRKERRQVRDHGVKIRLVAGNQLKACEWQTFHRLYRETFARHGNYPALTLDFFTELGRTMGDQVLVALAYRSSTIIGASFFLVGADTLYGRYWGCFEKVPGLHFEACYYQGIEFCINGGLKRFEPGAQGEHKISRGFLPTETWSSHWIRHPEFRSAIANFLEKENAHIGRYMNELSTHSPFKLTAQ